MTTSCADAPPPAAKQAPSENAHLAEQFPTAAHQDTSYSEENSASPKEDESEPLLRLPGVLHADGFLPASIRRPTGPPPPDGFPVAFIAHGAGGRGKDHCDFWEPYLPEYMWMVCPSGSLLRRNEPDGGAYFPDHLRLRAELTALIELMKSNTEFSLRISGWTYIGYSQGATMGALAVVPSKKDDDALGIFNELILIEGGGEYWTTRRAKNFFGQDGKRILFACGTKGCAQHAKKSIPVLEKALVGAELAYAPGAGHTYGFEVGRVLFDALRPWFYAPPLSTPLRALELGM